MDNKTLAKAETAQNDFSSMITLLKSNRNNSSMISLHECDRNNSSMITLYMSVTETIPPSSSYT